LFSGLQVWIEPGRDEGRHVEGLANAGAAASNKGAAVPASGLARDRREPDETCGLACFKGAEFRHFDQQGEGGDVGDALCGGEILILSAKERSTIVARTKQRNQLSDCQGLVRRL
jgi:hypothetical protein